MKISEKFPRYTDYTPSVPVWCITPNKGQIIHRFYDNSPVSPSGRYVALFRMPTEDRLPLPGEVGEIVLVDLHTAREEVIAQSRGWEQQLGAQINWGPNDETLYFNDVDITTWEAFAWKMNPLSGEKKRLGGTVYRCTPDGKFLYSFDLCKQRRTMYGYGVVIPDELTGRNYGCRENDGLYITDTDSGESKLLMSFKEVFECVGIPVSRYSNYEVYGAHVKISHDGSRISYNPRCIPKRDGEMWDGLYGYSDKAGGDIWTFTMKPNGTDVKIAVSAEQWAWFGHHMAFMPNGKLSMNLCFDKLKGDDVCYFTKVNYDGTDMSKIVDNIEGSGHPSVHISGNHVITDSYPSEANVSFHDGSVPIRFVDINKMTCTNIIRIKTLTPQESISSAFRVDPHPVWTPDWKHIIFNGFASGTRRVYIADLSKILI